MSNNLKFREMEKAAMHHNIKDHLLEITMPKYMCKNCGYYADEKTVNGQKLIYCFRCQNEKIKSEFIDANSLKDRNKCVI